jgi:hypothetical protein
MMKLGFIFGNILILAIGAHAQDSVLLNRSFLFEDGLYLTFEDFKNNKPAFSEEEFEMVHVVNPQTLLAQVASLSLASEQAFDLSSLWGICIDGRPYIQIDREEVGKDLASFAGMKVVGRLCFYSYQKPIQVPVEIKAYNPLTGKPFRSGTVDKTEFRENYRMLDFLDGTIRVFSKANLLDWVQEDNRISRLVRSLDPQDGETLLRALIAYNDRNLIFIKK